MVIVKELNLNNIIRLKYRIQYNIGKNIVITFNIMKHITLHEIKLMLQFI
ncbi:hypothetical protein CBU03nite_31260 [Clostridium butyricum]|nr:hypothetical protein Cbu04g_32360 [Clostridium butyricum]GEQ26703.1 hypothetical protein CBU03nite_31260 [Clostridium butyricum]